MQTECPENKMAKAFRLSPLVDRVSIRSRDMDPGRRSETPASPTRSTPEMGEEDA